MRPRNRRINRLQLGPIVGHTDHGASCVWIRVYDNPDDYTLRIKGHGLAPFVSTEGGQLEFRTAVAQLTGLRSDWFYRYQVLRRGRVVPGAKGSFRTLPLPGSYADVSFVSISCNAQDDLGLWQELAAHIKQDKPRFLMMLGDQVYLDDDSETPSVWKAHLNSSPEKRRKAMVRKYQESWSRPAIRELLANIPTYMMWDDHEIRDGWGSLAADSPTLAARYPAGQRIHQKYNAFFEDARDVFWHFQMCHNPQTLGGGPPPPGTRQSMPYAFVCGRALFLVVDSRGERDLWRTDGAPVLGQQQWHYIDALLGNLPADVDALVIATPVPIASMSPKGQTQHLVGHRTDDVERFRKGDAKGLLEMQSMHGDKIEIVSAMIGGWLRRHSLGSPNLGNFRLSDIDDARDQWSNHFSQAEQRRLLRTAAIAANDKRSAATRRAVLFLGGDLHAGGVVDIDIKQPQLHATCLISSGISKRTNEDMVLHVLVDEDFEIAKGMRARLQAFVNDFNYGVVRILPTGATPQVLPLVAHVGETSAWGPKDLYLNIGPLPAITSSG